MLKANAQVLVLASKVFTVTEKLPPVGLKPDDHWFKSKPQPTQPHVDSLCSRL